jgi:3-oxoadipate enol-lactonase
MPYVQSGEARLCYRWDGNPSGPVLLLSNSLGTDLAMWDRQVATLGEQFHLLRYDARGHGASTVTAGDYDIELLARDVIAILDRLQIATVHFCGLSLGGMVGQWLGAHAQQRIDRLVLCCTTARVAAREPWDERIRVVRSEGMAAVANTIIDRWFTKSYQQREPDSVDLIRRMLLRAPVAGYVGGCTAVRDMDLRESNARITAPTLVIWGAQDVSIPPEQSLAIANRVRGARKAELPGMHLCNIESAAAFNQAVLDFLAP